MRIQREKNAKPKYTYVVKDTYWRFRYRRFDASLPGQPGDPDFVEKYEQMVALVVKPEPVAEYLERGTFAFVIDRFFHDAEFKSLAESTQRTYRCMAKTVLRLLGDCDMTATTTEMVAGVRNAVRPGTATNMRAFVSRIYNFAMSRGYVGVGVNRARDLRLIKRKVAGHVPWSDDEVALLLKHAEGPIRTLIILALCTAQRSCDLRSLEWSQVIGDFVRVRQKKTNALVDIPLHPLLREELDFLRSKGSVSGRIVRCSDGQPISGRGFNERLATLIRSIPNMPHRTPHGARYAAAAMMEEAGCSVFQIQAVLGHTTFQQAMAYITKRRESGRGMDKLIAHTMPKAAGKWHVLHNPAPDDLPLSRSRDRAVVSLVRSV